MPSQPSCLPSVTRLNPFCCPQQQLIRQVESKTLDTTMYLSGVTPDLHSPKKVKSQIPRLQLVGEILGSTHKRGWGQKWPKMMLCSLFSETAEFGAAPGLCKALAATTAPGGLLSCTGLGKCGMLWPSSLWPRHIPFLGKVWGKNSAIRGPARAIVWENLSWSLGEFRSMY